MKRLNQFISIGLLISALSTTAFAHPGHGLSGGLVAASAQFLPGMHHLLPVIAAGLVMAVLLRCWRGRSTRGTTYRDWFAGRRR